MACDKGVSKLPATCNRHPHVGKVIPAEGLVLTDLSVSISMYPTAVPPQEDSCTS